MLNTQLQQSSKFTLLTIYFKHLYEILHLQIKSFTFITIHHHISCDHTISIRLCWQLISGFHCSTHQLGFSWVTSHLAHSSAL